MYFIQIEQIFGLTMKRKEKNLFDVVGEKKLKCLHIFITKILKL